MDQSTCSVGDCDRAVFVKSRGLCSKHYQRVMKTGSASLTRRTISVCKVEGCDALLRGSIGQGMCGKHYQRWRKYGSTDLPGHTHRQWWHDGRGTQPVTCTVLGCDRPSKSRGMCSAHDTRERRGLPPHRLCEWCWDVFVPRAGMQLTCSDECSRSKRMQYARSYQAEWRAEHPREPAPTHEARCWFCHTEFAATRRRYRYCSVECFKAARAVAGDPYTPRRRRWEAGGERFSRTSILVRDGWVCQICLEAIDRDATYPDPWSASIDHLVPLSRGGEHSRANTQAAHLLCNVKKGNRMP